MTDRTKRSTREARDRHVRDSLPEPTALGEQDVPGPEGGHAAPGEPEGTRGQLDAASGGYGSRSGISSGGTGDGQAGAAPGEAAPPEAGTSSAETGAAAEGPTNWVRGASGGPNERRTSPG